MILGYALGLLWGRSPKFIDGGFGRSETFRTSGGKATRAEQFRVL